MLPKKHRIPIQYLSAKSAKNIRSALLTVKVFPSNLPYSRFGVVISKKINKSAFKRNQLKRRAFIAAESLLEKLPAADYLAIINKQEITEDKLINELKSLLSRFLPHTSNI